MPAIEKTKEYLTNIWDIVKTLSVLFLIASTVASAIFWIQVNVFYPESIAIEVSKYLFLILASITVSTVILQIQRKGVENKIVTIKKETDKIESLRTNVAVLSDKVKKHEEIIPKIEELNVHVKKLSETTQQIHKNLSERVQKAYDNLQYFNNVFAIQCPNPKCRQWINIPIPASVVKEIHLVDGRPTGKFGQGREMQVKCDACEEVYHIVYP